MNADARADAPRLVLASSSKYRRALLERLGYPFAWFAPEVDESPLDAETPTELVARLARLKADTVARRQGHALVVGSDQIAVVGGQVLGKPGSAARACEQLGLLAGRHVRFLTGVCVVNSATDVAFEAVAPVDVYMRELTRPQIAEYVRREQPLDCAGAFKSEALGIALFERVVSDDPTALMGLPLITVVRLLARHGFDVLQPSPEVP
jgi:MAF protein